MQLGLEVTGSDRDDSVCVSVTGEIDATTVRPFVQSLRSAIWSGRSLVDVDLSNVDFMGSDGINVLIRMRKLADEEGVRLRIVKTSKQVRRVLDLMSLSDYLL